jgi:flagellar biosynthesis protein FlhF
MNEALSLVRAELGADAIILASRRVADGIELTAAIEPKEEPLIIESGPLAPLAPPGTDPLGPLRYHNLPISMARRLTTGPLDRTLSEAFSFSGMPDGISRPLMLAGPSGSGKTITCAKIVARQVMRDGTAPVVVTADCRRAGGIEQLAAFTRILEIPLVIAEHPSHFSAVMRRRVDSEGQISATFIDAPSADAFSQPEMDEMRGLASITGADIALVMPAGLDTSEAADIATAYAEAGARFLIPTRLDASRRLGGILAAAEAGRLTLSEAGTAPGVVDGLTQITPGWLAQRLAQTPQRTPSVR